MLLAILFLANLRQIKTNIMRKFILLLSAFFIIQQVSIAQGSYSWSKSRNKSITFTSGIESSLIQFAQAELKNKSLTTIPRYSYFFNTGFDVNFKIDNNIKIFTGLNVKNLGFIYKLNDSIRYKHRVYTFGAPFGFKIHSNDNKVIFKTGIDISMAFNYKMKKFVNDDKTKFSEYFSNRTSLFFPSLFAGLSVHGVSVTANYYLNNFFNPLHPAVLDMDARLFTIGVGLNFDNGKMKVKKKKTETTTAE